ncbi:hypothetical protein C4544_03765 [candidate division WS5 bacterium]|uniref:Uncharacterized protein n=1 Tax=candidate division WS5 bacterium TaxID=2093353 RepID=A0A419DD75_9BACT|nr:MAG: hypothetical protein C4544_03765 [candidate division WS5 bacterium]
MNSFRNLLFIFTPSRLKFRAIITAPALLMGFLNDRKVGLHQRVEGIKNKKFSWKSIKTAKNYCIGPIICDSLISTLSKKIILILQLKHTSI